MSVFEEACYLSNQRWIASFPKEFEAIEFSKQHEKRMRILFDKMRRDKYHRFTKRATIALIAAILIISMTITAFAIPASRDYIIHKFFDHSTYTVVNGEHNEVGEITIGYIPDGFEKTYEYIDDTERIHTYTANNEWIEISKMSLGLKTDIDTESNNYREIIYNNKTYLSYDNKTSNAFIWNDGNFEYVITSSNLSNDILLKIADSVT